MNLTPPEQPKPYNFTRPIIVCFFQMDWFTVLQGERLTTLHRFYRDPESFRDMLQHTPVGKVLKQVFKDLYDRIVWRMANPGPKLNNIKPRAAGDFITDYHPGYILKFLGTLKPEIIIGLGDSAKHGVGEVISQVPHTGPCLFGKHPLEPGAVESLVALAAELRAELKHFEPASKEEISNFRKNVLSNILRGQGPDGLL